MTSSFSLNPVAVEAAAKGINDELRRKGRTFSLPPEKRLAEAAIRAFLANVDADDLRRIADTKAPPHG